MREKLELDLIGCKTWIRSMEETEYAHAALIADLGEAQASVHAQADLVSELRDKVCFLYHVSPLPL